jgi:hypothetical protein
MATMGPEDKDNRMPAHLWRAFQDDNYGKNREGEEDFTEAANRGRVNLVKMGAQQAYNREHPYTFEDWAMEAIADQAEMNALLRAYAKHLPEHLLPVQMPGWVYTQNEINPLKEAQCKYARAFVLFAQEHRIEPDIEAIAIYTGISGHPEKVKALDAVLREEFALETNKTLLDYMIDQHHQVKKGLAHSIWDNFPGFRLKEITKALEAPAPVEDDEDADLRPPEGKDYGPAPPVEH